APRVPVYEAEIANPRDRLGELEKRRHADRLLGIKGAQTLDLLKGFEREDMPDDIAAAYRAREAELTGKEAPAAPEPTAETGTEPDDTTDPEAPVGKRSYLIQRAVCTSDLADIIAGGDVEGSEVDAYDKALLGLLASASAANDAGEAVACVSMARTAESLRTMYENGLPAEAAPVFEARTHELFDAAAARAGADPDAKVVSEMVALSGLAMNVESLESLFRDDLPNDVKVAGGARYKELTG